VSAVAVAGSAETWFGDAFDALHPRLQALHRDGGRLLGPVRFRVGPGIAGWLGRIGLRRLGIDPHRDSHMLTVDIAYDGDALRWARRFDEGPLAVSMFRPEGHWPDGCWRERVGPFDIALGVDLQDGGWRWRQRAWRVFGCPLPTWLAPRIDAGKGFEDGQYRFDVAIDLPLVGRVLAWEGRLRLV